MLLDGMQNMSFGANDGGMTQELTIDGEEDGGHDPFDPATTVVLATRSNVSRMISPSAR